jgi:NTE family protein
LDGVSVRPIEARQIDGSAKKTDLVFEGGGVKGIALVGALSLLVEQGYDVPNPAGASAGAVVAILYASGYSAEEAHTRIADQNFGAFLDSRWIGYVPGVGIPLSLLSLLSLLSHLGVYRGRMLQRRIWEILWQILKARGTYVWQLVRPEHQEDPKYRCKGAGDLDVALAVRISSSTPLFFDELKHDTERKGGVRQTLSEHFAKVYMISMSATARYAA